MSGQWTILARTSIGVCKDFMRYNDIQPQYLLALESSHHGVGILGTPEKYKTYPLSINYLCWRGFLSDAERWHGTPDEENYLIDKILASNEVDFWLPAGRITPFDAWKRFKAGKLTPEEHVNFTRFILGDDGFVYHSSTDDKLYPLDEVKWENKK